MTVLVAYSADVYGRAALDHGIAEAERSGDRLVVVNVTKGDALVDVRYAGESDTAAVHERLAGLSVDAELQQFMASDVADKVLSVADSEGARLLVVGIRRRSAVGKLIMGSVAQRLILDAHCPVVAVKPAED